MRRIHHDTLDSTSDEARRLLPRHPGEVLLVTAGQQTAGRGRRGRTWHSPRGGVWLSLAWPTRREPGWYEPAPLVAALATWEAIVACAGDGRATVEPGLRIKWPNDLLLSGRKVGGILCEHAFEHQALIVGVGINANLSAAALPGNVRQPATTLRDALGRPVDLPTLTGTMADGLASSLAAFDAAGFTDTLRQRIEQRLAFAGEPVHLHIHNRTACGTVHGLAPTGGLVLDRAGQRETFTAGEVRQLQIS